MDFTDHTLTAIVTTIVSAVLAGVSAMWAAGWKLAQWTAPRADKLIDGHLKLMDSLQQSEETQTGILREIAQTQAQQVEASQRISNGQVEIMSMITDRQMRSSDSSV